MPSFISYRYKKFYNPVILGLIVILLLTACGSAAPASETGVPVTGGNTPTVASPTEAGPTLAAATDTTAPPAEEASPTEAVETAADEADNAGIEPIACTAPAALTPALTEGPYYSANPPERTSLVDENTPGTRLHLSGYVLTADCQPVPGARVDFWQAGADGQYDNTGYNLRGYQLTDGEGRYQLETVVPGEYSGRTQHIHVKVTAPGNPELTSQLFMPEASGNQTDRIFDPALVVTWQPVEDGYQAVFNFIVSTP